MSAISVANPLAALPPQTVVLDMETIDHRDRLLERAHGWIGKITDDDAFAEANAAFADLHQFGKLVEEGRQKLTAPALAYQRSLKAAADEATVGVEGLKRELGASIAAYEAKRRAARAAAEAEARRQEEEARRAAEEQALMDLPPGEEAPAFVAPVKVAAVPVAVAPVPESAVVTRQVSRVEITDASLLPARIGALNLVKEWDLKALEVALKAGLITAGARIVTETVTAAKGRR